MYPGFRRVFTLTKYTLVSEYTLEYTGVTYECDR